MKQYKKDRLRKLVSWGYITRQQANQLWCDYLRLFKQYRIANIADKDLWSVTGK